jgi:hypothetical protein
MARFEVTISNGEKILVDHVATTMHDILSELGARGFLLFNEVKGGSSAPAREVIIASAQVTLVRPMGDRSMQGSDFKPKR